ncbi:MAG: hypothetical protein KME64_35380 [Scytonematopsis contorta HA4267-MV1]|jgi:hypothetical protein|nr:hypothetical protein [Scytonematopsis contorta HA4267-MV1]
MSFIHLKRLLSLLSLTGLVLAVGPISMVRAESSSDVFAASPILQERWFKGGYNVLFVPKGNYTYKIQVAGQDRDNNWTCDQYAAVEITKLTWDKVRAQFGLGKDSGGSVEGDGQVVSVMGREVDRNWGKVYKTMHFRVVAQADGNQEVYKHNWQTDNAANLTDWNKVKGCEWVAN